MNVEEKTKIDNDDSNQLEPDNVGEDFFMMHSEDEKQNETTQTKPVSDQNQKVAKKKTFNCPKCNDKFSVNYQLRKHMDNRCLYSKKYHGKWKEIDPTQGKITIEKGEQRIEDDGPSESDESSIDLDECAKKTETVVSNSGEQIKEYSCNMCSKVFKHARSLMAHIVWHKNRHVNFPFSCHAYSSRHRSQSKLDQHIQNVHTMVKCKYPNCYYQNSKLNLSKHVKRVHLKLYQYKCDFCEYMADSPSKLKTHIGIHTNEKNFKCQFCEYRSNQRSNTQNHEKLYCKYRKKDK